MAQWFEVREIAIDGAASGKFRMTERHDDPEYGPVGLCEHMHDTRQEADECPDAIARLPKDILRGRMSAEEQLHADLEDLVEKIRRKTKDKVQVVLVTQKDKLPRTIRVAGDELGGRNIVSGG